MKIVNFLLPLLIASAVKAREFVLEESERDVDNGDGNPNELPCKVSPDGTFRSTSSDYVVEATFAFEIEYETSYDVVDLFEKMNQHIGNHVISKIFSSCQSRRRRLFDLHYDNSADRDLSDVDSFILGMDINAEYASEGSCSMSSEGNACKIMTSGYKVYLKQGSRKDIVGEKILGIVKDVMNDGEAAGMVDGITSLKFGRTDGEPNEENEGEDEKAAEEIQEQVLDEENEGEDEKAAEEVQEQVLEENLEGDTVGQITRIGPDDGTGKVSPKSGASYGWVILGVSTVVIALVVHQYHKSKKETSRSQLYDESDCERNNIIKEAPNGRGEGGEDSVEVVFDSGTTPST